MTPSRTGIWPGVRGILAARPDSLKAVNERGYTPLHIAAREGRVEIASFLIEKGADLEAKNPTGYTPLFLAVRSKRPEIVRFLLEKGADVNAQTRFQTTPLFTAAESGNVEVIRALIEKGANVNHANPFFGSPLHRAAYMDFPEAAKVLLDAGADLKIKDQRGQTPLHQAAQLGRVGDRPAFRRDGAPKSTLSTPGTGRPCTGPFSTGRDGTGRTIPPSWVSSFWERGPNRYDRRGGRDAALDWPSKRGYTDLAGAILRRGGDIAARSPAPAGRFFISPRSTATATWPSFSSPAASTPRPRTWKGRRRSITPWSTAIRRSPCGWCPRSGGRRSRKSAPGFSPKRWPPARPMSGRLNHRGWAVKTKIPSFHLRQRGTGPKTRLAVALQRLDLGPGDLRPGYHRPLFGLPCPAGHHGVHPRPRKQARPGSIHSTTRTMPGGAGTKTGLYQRPGNSKIRRGRNHSL